MTDWSQSLYEKSSYLSARFDVFIMIALQEHV